MADMTPVKKVQVREHHPALKFYVATLVLLGLMILLGFIAVFVPWVMKDIAVGTRAWAYPFKTCFEDTFSIVNAESCMDNDFIEPTGAPLTGSNSQCKAFVLATIAFVFLSVLGGVVVLLLMLWVTLTLWSRPTCLAGAVQAALILVCIFANLSWIMFICYAEKTCAPNSIFPVQGYSYGFIIYIFASACVIAAVVTGFMGFKRIRANEARQPGEVDDLLPAAAESPEGSEPAAWYPAEDPLQPSPSSTPHQPSGPVQQV